MQLLQFEAHLHAQLGVEVGERLIKQKDGGIADDRPAHRHALTLAAGKLPRATFQQAIQLQNTRCLFDPLGDMRFTHAANF